MYTTASNFTSRRSMSGLLLSILACAGITSILASPSYRYNNGHHLFRRSTSLASSSSSSPSSKSYKKELNTINSWNVRSLSSIHLSAQPPYPSVHSTAYESGIDSVSTTSTTNSNNNRRAFRRIRSNRRGMNSNVNNGNVISLTRGSNNEKQDSAGEYFHDDGMYTPSREVIDMKANLGPIGLLVANAVEVGITTASSYVSGGFLGYCLGGVMGVPTLFQKNNGGLKNLNAKALTQGKSWATLSASFSGFHALTRVCRGDKNDRWNSVIGSACAGAYLSREGGVQAMISAASTYACFTIVIDMVFGQPSNSSSGLNKEFDFTDTPIEERGY